MRELTFLGPGGNQLSVVPSEFEGLIIEAGEVSPRLRFRLRRFLEDLLFRLPVSLRDSSGNSLPLWGEEDEEAKEEFLRLPEEERKKLLLQGAGLVAGLVGIKKPLLPPGEAKPFHRPLLSWEDLSALVAGQGADLRGAVPPERRTFVLGMALYHFLARNPSGLALIAGPYDEVLKGAERVAWEYESPFDKTRARSFALKTDWWTMEVVSIAAESAKGVGEFLETLEGVRKAVGGRKPHLARSLEALADEVRKMAQRKLLFLVDEERGDPLGVVLGRLFGALVIV